MGWIQDLAGTALPRVEGLTLALVPYLDVCRRYQYLDLLALQRRRHAIIGFVFFNVNNAGSRYRLSENRRQIKA